MAVTDFCFLADNYCWRDEKGAIKLTSSFPVMYISSCEICCTWQMCMKWRKQLQDTKRQKCPA